MTTDPAPDLAALLAAVDDVGPLAEKFSTQAEEECHLADEVVDAFHDHGLFRLKSPTEVGGFEVAPVEFMQVLAALAYHDTSAAWNLTIGSSSTAFAGGWLSDEGVETVFAGDRFPVLAGQVAPNGVATPVDGGFRVTGRWGFGSGIRQADFALGGARVGDRGAVMVFMPIDDVDVDAASWDTAGLRGTGSYDYAVEDLFVPDSMTADLTDLRARRGGPLFAQSIDVFVANEIPAFVSGALERAIDELVAVADGTTRFMASSSLADRVAFQAIVGRAQARLTGITALADDRVGAAWHEAREQGEVAPATAAALHSANVLICEDATALLAELYRFGGGRVIKAPHPVQRIVRDVMAAAQHITVSNEHYERAGRLRLGR